MEQNPERSNCDEPLDAQPVLAGVFGFLQRHVYFVFMCASKLPALQAIAKRVYSQQSRAVDANHKSVERVVKSIAIHTPVFKRAGVRSHAGRTCQGCVLCHTSKCEKAERWTLVAELNSHYCNSQLSFARFHASRVQVRTLCRGAFSFELGFDFVGLLVKRECRVVDPSHQRVVTRLRELALEM